MKKLLYILLFVPLALFGQEITPEMFVQPAITGANMTVGFNASIFNQFEGGQIGAFLEDWEGIPECVGLASIQIGFFGLSLIADDSPTPEPSPWCSGCTPQFSILHNGNVIMVAESPQFTGYVYNGIVNITDANFFSNELEFGCNDISSINYNSEADYDDGSCIPIVEGCTNPIYLEYNINANTDDGSCSNEIVEGCTDILAPNYYEQANTDNGSCIYYGCINVLALNYNSDANTDDGSCYYDILTQLYIAFDSWNSSIDLVEGWNMYGYGCPTPIDVSEALSGYIESIIITKDNNGNVYMPEFGFNGIGDYIQGFGYQIKLVEAIEGFSLCDWYVNDIPEDNIVSLQDSLELINSQIGCTDILACNYEINKLYNDGSCEYPAQGYDCDGIAVQYEVGVEAEGGIVFYVDNSGQRGLVVAMEDLPETYNWGCFGISISGADEQSIGYGYQNTLDIVSGCSERPIAASASLAIELEGYNDWYLPSREELVLVYQEIVNGNDSAEYILGDGPDNSWYWTSSEADLEKAYNLGVYDLFLGNTNKLTGLKVRPIRYFGNWTLGCMDQTACNFNPEVNMADGSCTYSEQGYDYEGNEIITYQVGDLAQGGIVFYVDECGHHGLVASLDDINSQWGCYATDLPGAEGADIGTGYQNTLDIVEECSQTITGAYLAFFSNANNYNDWYLPSILELYEMYTSIGPLSGNIGGFYQSFYWSSTEYDSGSGLGLHFNSGLVEESFKGGLQTTRIIRSF